MKSTIKPILVIINSFPKRQDVFKNYLFLSKYFTICNINGIFPKYHNWELYKDNFYIKEKINRKYVLGNIGCLKSHLKAYSIIEKGKLDYGFICEDDVIFNENCLIQFLSNIKTLDTWDLVYGYKGYSPYIDHKITYNTAKYVTHTLFYGITKQLIEKIKTYDIIYHGCEIDMFLVNNIQPKYNCFHVTPEPVLIDTQYTSNIQ